MTLLSGVTFAAAGYTALRGTIDNGGTLLTGGALVIDGPATLAGHGQFVLNGGAVYTAADARFAAGSTLAPALINADNTISGKGGFHSSGLAILNQAGGVIDADVSGQQLYLAGTVTNQGLIEASGEGQLDITGTVENDGLIRAAGGTLA